MVKKTVWTLFVVIVVGAVPSAVCAQGPGGANPGQGRPALPPGNGGLGADGRMNVPPGMPALPPAVPGVRDPEKRRNDHDAWTNIHSVAHGLAHGLPSSNGPNAGHGVDMHPPVVSPEAGVAASELRFVPASELRCNLPKVTPVMSEGGAATARALSRGKGGGILGGIGAALAAGFGAIFGRKKES